MLFDESKDIIIADESNKIKYISVNKDNGDSSTGYAITAKIFSNLPMSKGIMNRPLTETENYLIAEIRSRMQYELEYDKNINLKMPMEFSIDLRDVAAQRGIKYEASLKRVMADIIHSLSRNIPSIQIEYLDDKGYHNTAVMPLLDFINFTRETGIISVRTGVTYQNYYARYIMNYPELRIPKAFYYKMKSKYSMPLADLIIGIIGDLRNQGNIETEYIFEIPIESLMAQVICDKQLIARRYVKIVIDAAVADINANPESPIKILNPDDIRVRKGLKIIALRFHVKLLNTKESIYISYADTSLINQLGVPSEEYITDYLRDRLNVNDRFMDKVMKSPAVTVWKAILYTMVYAEHPGAKYFNKILSDGNLSEYSVRYLAGKFREKHPELVDDVIESILTLEL